MFVFTLETSGQHQLRIIPNTSDAAFSYATVSILKTMVQERGRDSNSTAFAVQRQKQQMCG
jgi:hypothetical protein